MKPIHLLSALLIALLWSCTEKRPVERMNDEQLQKYASELANKFLIVDGHVDLPERLLPQKAKDPTGYPAMLNHSSLGDFDYERAKAGGLDGPFMSIYIPVAVQQRPDFGKAYADSLIDMVEDIPKVFPEHFALAKTPADVRREAGSGKIALPMGMENGAPVGMDLSRVRYFFDRGIRYMTLTHSKYNQICGSSGDTIKTHQGLTPFGRKVVGELNKVGIMVDISHVDDSTFYQVMDLTTVPSIASHSSCRAFAPEVPRDMTDDMILRMGKNGGVILVNFYTAFLDSASGRRVKELHLLMKQKGIAVSDSLGRAMEAQLRKDHPLSIEVVADHIDHIVKLIGIDHVGFGSDFDGVDEFLPAGLEDVSHFPNLIYTLLKRGYREEEIGKICGGNFMRVWQEALDAAKN